MKDFFKMVFACLIAMGLVVAGLFFMFLLFIGMLVASMMSSPDGQGLQVVQPNSLLIVDMGIQIQDAPVMDQDLETLRRALGRGGPSKVSLRKIVEGIKAAADDDDIKGLYLHDRADSSGPITGYAALK